MDPESNLQEQLSLAQNMVEGKIGQDWNVHDAARLAELVLALHDWLTRGGFKPEAWQKVGGK